jgi:hypothetical protein
VLPVKLLKRLCYPDVGTLLQDENQVRWQTKRQPRCSFCLQGEGGPDKGVLYTADAEARHTATVDEAVLENYVKSPSAQHLPNPIPHRASKALLHVLRLAVATEKAPFIIVALSTVQQMVAAGYIQGEANSLVLEGEMTSGNEGGVAAKGMSKHPENLGVAAQVLHLVCTCEEYCNDDEIEARSSSSTRIVKRVCKLEDTAPPRILNSTLHLRKNTHTHTHTHTYGLQVLAARLGPDVDRSLKDFATEAASMGFGSGMCSGIGLGEKCL